MVSTVKILLKLSSLQMLRWTVCSGDEGISEVRNLLRTMITRIRSPRTTEELNNVITSASLMFSSTYNDEAIHTYAPYQTVLTRYQIPIKSRAGSPMSWS